MLKYLHISKKSCTFAAAKEWTELDKGKSKIMCTVTLQYDQSSALARRKMAALLASGLFTQITIPVMREDSKEEEVITPAMRRRINKARKCGRANDKM